MRNIYTGLFFAVMIWLFSSCSSDDNQQLCVEHFLEEFNMEPYEGQEITNEFFLWLYTYENANYAQLGSHVADLVGQIPIDCDGNALCTEVYGEDCGEVHRNAKLLGIIGIRN